MVLVTEEENGADSELTTTSANMVVQSVEQSSVSTQEISSLSVELAEALNHFKNAMNILAAIV